VRRGKNLMESLPHHVLCRLSFFLDIHAFITLFTRTSHTLRSFFRTHENLLYRVLVFRDFPDNVTDVENLAYPHFWYEHYISTHGKMKKRDEIRTRMKTLLEQYRKTFDLI
jgi:hypothetical protein